MKAFPTIIGLTLASSSFIGIADVDPIEIVSSTPDAWTLEDAQERCRMALNNESQLKGIKIDIECKKISRSWLEQTDKFQLCPYNTTEARVFAKNRPVESLNPGLKSTQDLSPFFAKCHNYIEQIMVLKKSMAFSCSKILQWNTMGDALSECEGSRIGSTGQYQQNDSTYQYNNDYSETSWIAQPEIAWENLTEDDRLRFPELKPKKFSTCIQNTCPSSPTQN